jgi:hypothetical protein
MEINSENMLVSVFNIFIIQIWGIVRPVGGKRRGATWAGL